jgi:hypothetical protein
MTGKKKQRKSIENKSNAQKKYTLAIRRRQPHESKIAREYFFSYPRKIKKQKISLPSKK